MKRGPDPSTLVEGLDRLLEIGETRLAETMETLAELAQAILESSPTADPRLRRLVALANEAVERRRDDALHARGTFLVPLGEAASALDRRRASVQSGSILARLASAPGAPLDAFCSALLDTVIEELEARGGFVVLCRPDSTEAEIACARNYESRNLSLDEHRPSRSVIREVLCRGGAVRLEDAAAGEGPASLESVRELGLRSLLAVPIGHPPLGVLYLDHAEPGRFSRATTEALTVVASWVAAHLRRARLLPAAEATGPRVFLDADQATRALVGNDPRMREVLSVIARVADREATVLICGESGTGKELVARALHYQSARREHPFVAVNSAAIPEQLFESELFGHERGAFTGADRRYVGRLEQADGGTLFLDEIDEMPFGLQAKLLRFLESKVISPLGSNEARRLDVRVVAATSRDLASAADDGTFQKSLYFRLNVIPIDLPPLRERRGDIPLLVEHFLNRYGTLYGRRLALAPETLELLGRYDFPGNVRELENLVHRLAALCESDVSGPADLPREVGGPSGVPFQLGIDPALEAAGRAPDLETFRRHRQRILDRLAEEERCVAERAVEEAGGSVSQAARRLGVHRVTLHRMLKRGS